MSRLVSLAATLALAVTTALAGATAADGAPHAGHAVVAKPSAASKYAAQAFTATNANRAHAGLKALKPNDCLRHAAARQAKKMAQQERMFHQDLGLVLRECQLGAAGENVAFGFSSGKSVVNNGWMNSQGHRDNILSTSFTLMGIGARKGHNGQWYVSQVFGRKG